MQASEQTETLTEAEKHMTTAVAQFNIVEQAGDGGDYSSITDTYLEPLRLNWSAPDYSRLEKPPKPPVPEVNIYFHYKVAGIPGLAWVIVI